MKRSSVVFLLLCLALVTAGKLRAQGTGEILHAEYGADTNWVDVTQRVGSMLHNNNASFRIQSSTFDIDPAQGERKGFRLVTREANGKIQHLEFTENQNITLRGYTFDSDSKGLRILGAEYGAGKQLADVTGKVDALVKGGQLIIRATDEALGADPAPTQPKTLTIWYVFNGVVGQAVVKENDAVRMPGGDGLASLPSR
jgi:hypothetical protein